MEDYVYHFERTYKTARGVSSGLEILGWCVFAFGSLAALAGLFTGGIPGAIFGPTAYSEGAIILLRILGAIPGLFVMASGLAFVLYVQSSRASIDTAEMTRELLRRADGAVPHVDPDEGVVNDRHAETGYGSVVAPGDQSSAPEEERREYLGEEIVKRDGRYYALEQKFKTLGAAKKYIKQSTQGSW